MSECGQNSNQNDTVGNKLDPDWSYNIADNILELQVVKLNVTEYCISILGEKHFFCLTENGKLVFMKRYDFTPHCFDSYFIGKCQDYF